MSILWFEILITRIKKKKIFSEIMEGWRHFGSCRVKWLLWLDTLSAMSQWRSISSLTNMIIVKEIMKSEYTIQCNTILGFLRLDNQSYWSNTLVKNEQFFLFHFFHDYVGIIIWLLFVSICGMTELFFFHTRKLTLAWRINGLARLGIWIISFVGFAMFYNVSSIPFVWYLLAVTKKEKEKKPRKFWWLN